MEGTSASLVTIAESKLTKKTNPEDSNEEPQKKIIKLSELSELNNLDPLEYFSRFLDISEMILQHLNVKELIKISEVSPSSYSAIASSKVLMEKIKIVFKIGRGQKMLKEDYDLLRNSSRLYQNVEVCRYFEDDVCSSPNGQPLSDHDYIHSIGLDFFQEKTHDWKNVSLNEIYFRNELDLWKFLSSIESSVENLSIKNQNFNQSRPLDDSSSDLGSFKVLNFPKLKQLKLCLDNNSNFSDAYGRFLVNSIAIEDLELGGDELVKGGVLTRMLENFDKLTSLKVKSIELRRLFEDDSWKSFKFKLNSLTLHFVKYFGFIELRNFLKSQNDHLEELNIEVFTDKELFNAIMKMTKLKKVFLQYCFVLHENDVPNEVSTSISDVKLNYYVNGSLKFLLKSMPNVRRLSTIIMNQELIEALLEMERKFDELRYHKLNRIDQEALTKICDNISICPYSLFVNF